MTADRAAQVRRLNARTANLRMDRKLVERLAAAAEARDVSASWLAGRLLTEGLDNLVPVSELKLTRPR